MIYVGIDDTDMPGTPGTNQFCRALVERISRFRCRLIVRHQLLVDRRVPYTSKNSCASLQLVPSDGVRVDDQTLDALQVVIRRFLGERFVSGSDPAFCVTTHVPRVVVEFGQRCQQEVVTQQEARDLAASQGIHLEGCGGTEDGVIGSLAAVGLAANGDDGRVVKIGEFADDLSGRQRIAKLLARDVDVRCLDSGDSVCQGTVDVGKHLRPNYRGHKIVLFAERVGRSPVHWNAVRLP